MNFTAHKSCTFKYWGYFILFLFLELCIVTWAAHSFFSALTRSAMEKNNKEFKFLQYIIQEKLQEDNFTSVVYLVSEIGKLQEKHFTEINLKMANGFVLGSYHSSQKSQHTETMTAEIPYSYNRHALLECTVSMDFFHTQRKHFSFFWGLGLLAANILLAAMIRLYIRKNLLTDTLHIKTKSLGETIDTLQQEIKARINAETELILSEEKYRTLMDNLNDAIFFHEWKKNLFATFNEVNQYAIETYGYSRDEFLQLSARDLLPSAEFQRFIDNAYFSVLKEKGYIEITTTHIKKTGERMPVEIKASLIRWQEKNYILSNVRDIGERIRIQAQQQELKQQILHAQKLKSLGVMAGGIAHDFNNIMMVILGNTEMAIRKLPENETTTEHLKLVMKAGKKAADLSNQMLAYAGHGKFIVEPVDISALVLEMKEMLRASISKKAAFRCDLSKNLPPIEADASQIRQVILNLVINASDALNNKSGLIVISTGLVDAPCNNHSEKGTVQKILQGPHVFLEVVDTGCGMNEETISQIFDPFFTTKFTGRGLGMSSVQGIVHGHKGHIHIESEEEKGSTITISFPLAQSPATLQEEPAIIEMPQNNQIALLVDDEEMMRNLGAEMLKLLGFTVITAADGQEAVEKYRLQQENIAFVLMDLMMPRMDGEEAFHELRSINTKVKIIMSSGYSDLKISGKFSENEMVAFLHKPYQLADLKRTIADLHKEC